MGVAKIFLRLNGIDGSADAGHSFTGMAFEKNA
jgi:hypothetical protein